MTFLIGIMCFRFGFFTKKCYICNKNINYRIIWNILRSLMNILKIRITKQ